MKARETHFAAPSSLIVLFIQEERVFFWLVGTGSAVGDASLAAVIPRRPLTATTEATNAASDQQQSGK